MSGKKIKPLLLSTGKAADGDRYYFNRKNIEEKIWRKIKGGEDILIAAPRRTGKSSMLKYIEKKPQNGYLVKYKSVQAIDSINEYFKQIYKILIEDDALFTHFNAYCEKAKGALKSFISKIREISASGIAINPEENIDYYQETKILINSIPEDFGVLLFLMDEFPDAVRNVSKNNENDGVQFLQLIRDLRQEFNNKKIQFVYSGSIGLSYVVKKLQRLDLIADIVKVTVPPLNKNEAMELIDSLELGINNEYPKFIISDQVKKHILKKDHWIIPYYVQIIIDELFDHYCDTTKIPTKKIVDQVINNIIKNRYKYQDYFENWKTRLQKAFAHREYKFALEILNNISVQNEIDKEKLIDIGVKNNIEDIKDVIDVLQYDGYIANNPDGNYQFNSLILKQWWYINVAS